MTSAVGGADGRHGARRLLIFQYSVHPFFGGQFGPLTFMICVLGGLGNMVGAFVASFVMSEIISIAGVIWSTEMGYVIAFVVFIVMIFAPAGRYPGQARVNRARRRCSRGPAPDHAIPSASAGPASTSSTS